MKKKLLFSVLILVIGFFAYFKLFNREEHNNLVTVNEIHRGNGTEPQTLDVHKSTGVYEQNIQWDLFEGLASKNAAGEIIPGTAESWAITEDGKTYTFQLRKEAKWSNGDPVTAEDFVYSFRRAVDPQTAAATAFMLWPIQNAEAITKGKQKPVELGVRAIDSHVLEITLEHRTPYFIEMLTHHIAAPVHQKTIETHKERWTQPENIVSNGPYVLKEWVPNSHITLVKNPYYYAADQVILETVIYYPTEDKNSELKRFRSGELEVTDMIPSDQVAWVKDNMSESFRAAPWIGTYFYAFNLTREPFKSHPELVEALSLVIDREKIVRRVTRGEEIPAYSMVPPGVMNYKPQFPSFKEMSQEERDARALKLYEAAGFSEKNPLKIEILYNTDENHKKVAIAVAAMWKKVLGVQTELTNVEWKVYLTRRNAKDFQVVRSGWIADYNDPKTFLDMWVTEGGLNTAGYHNEEFDKLIEKADDIQDLEKRAEILGQAEQVLFQRMPTIPIYFYTSKRLISPKVEGWVENIMDVHPSRYLKIK